MNCFWKKKTLSKVQNVEIIRGFQQWFKKNCSYTDCDATIMIENYSDIE